MFPYNDPQAMLDIHRQRAAELSRHAASTRAAREAGSTRVSRFGRWPRRSRGEQAGHAAVTA
ncbi:hypothetical protein [Actinoplanes solisilvae]|uniref:hypothetical protein n=1 Tax=Actinoplanes solisilvae TaxID=2486853 RepID=UPI000FDA49B0|nr:hypothetical protein [Actinoplanes solisilvae]